MIAELLSKFERCLAIVILNINVCTTINKFLDSLVLLHLDSFV